MIKREELNGFAVDLGGTKLAAARIEQGQLVERKQTITATDADANAQCEAIRDLLIEIGWTDQPVGIAVAGRVTVDGQWSAVNKGTLTNLGEVAFRDVARQLLGVPVSLANDALAAATAEAHVGAGVGITNFAYITISTGVGGGIVIDGNPLTSQNGLAGHIGFMSSRLGDKRCGSGRLGTVESVAGGRAIAALASEQGHDVANAKQVFDAALNGEAWAQGLVDQSANAISILIADLTSLLGLERVALGGSIGLAEGYLERVQAHLNEEPALFRPQLMPASFGAR